MKTSSISSTCDCFRCMQMIVCELCGKKLDDTDKAQVHMIWLHGYEKNPDVWGDVS